MFCPGYDEIDESNMDPPQAQTPKKVSEDNFEAPPLPCRSKIKQEIKWNRNPVATLITSDPNDDAPSDTDSGYEYVANPMKKRTLLSLSKLANHQGRNQNENHGNRSDYKSQPKMSTNFDKRKPPADPLSCGNNCKSIFSLLDKPISTSPTSKKVRQGVTNIFLMEKGQQHTHQVTRPQHHEICIIPLGDEGYIEDAVDGIEARKGDQTYNEELFKNRIPSKTLSGGNIIYRGMSQQDIHCTHNMDIISGGYQKLIKETMEPVSRQYQKLNKLTMEPRLAIMVTPKSGPQCGKFRRDTL